MNIKNISIEKIKPAKYNPRKDLNESDPEYQRIKKSIEDYELVEPLVWNEYNGVLIGGHQRLKVLKEKGYREIPVSVVNIKEQNKEKALNLALNKASGQWETESLESILRELKGSGFETGFDPRELEEIIGAEDIKGLTDEDEVPEPPKEAKTKPGDLYILGNHRLLCGDSTKISDVERLMDGKKADMVFTDPPYNTGMQGKEGSTRLSHMFKDSYKNDEWETFLSDVFTNYHEWTKSEAAIYACIDWRRVSDIREAMGRIAKVSNVIVWDKVVHGLGSDYKYTYELIVVGKKGKPKINNRYGEDYQDVWHVQRKVGRNDDHATAKPIELCEKPIKHASKEDDIVLDLFLGSGSTLIASERLSRVCYGMEIDPIYCDVIVKRWEDYTGKKAVIEKKEAVAA